MLSQTTVDRYLSYDRELGILKWKRTRRIAGCIDNGYCRIRVENRLYFRHQIIWLLETGQWPIEQVDHKDLDRANDRFSNLRLATHAENNQNRGVKRNNKLGVKGVVRSPTRGKFLASIKGRYIGTFNTIEAAKEAYDRQAKELFGEFYRS